MSPTIVLIGLYAFIRLLSFATLSVGWIQTVIAALAVLFMAYFGVRKPLLAWYILIAEFFLGGNGHFFELFGIAVRTWFFVIFFSCWLIRKFKAKKLIDALQLPKILKYTILSLGFSVLIGIIVGISNEHDLHAIISDAIPYFFLLLLFPAKEFIQQTSKKDISYIIISYLTGTALFALFTETLFSSGLSILQSPYYHWFRDVVGGKITDVGEHFFRVTSPEYLLLPIILIFINSLLIQKKEKTKTLWLLFILAAIPMLLSVSRTFILAYLIGLLFLFQKNNWKQWFKISLISIISLLILFSSIHFIVSRGKSFGFELFSSRFGGIVNPDSEVSSASRKTLLAPIFEKIKAHPIVGSGLAETLTFIEPKTNNLITTTQFDWGYLEIWTELGLLGLFSTLSLIFYLLLKLFKQNKGLLACTVSLAFMQITTPAIFHVFGVVTLLWLFTNCVSSLQFALPPHTLQHDVAKKEDV
jgi:O-antigen ligase